LQEELERRGMTFQFVGQDMAAMRLMPFIAIEARGQYQWKTSYKVFIFLKLFFFEMFCKCLTDFYQGDWTQHFAKTKKHPGG
jgi:hypothetical protein